MNGRTTFSHDDPDLVELTLFSSEQSKTLETAPLEQDLLNVSL
jgi:hypothetical protein